VRKWLNDITAEFEHLDLVKSVIEHNRPPAAAEAS
jgi:hypothetical protein